MSRFSIGGNSESFGQTLFDQGCSLALSQDDYAVNFIYAQWYIKDYISSTRGMTGEEEGIYVRFLMLLYDRGKPIPDDDAFVARLLSLSTRVWKRLKAIYVSSGKLIARNSALTNSRFEEERQKRAGELRRSSESAKLRWARTRGEEAEEQNENRASLPEVSPKFAGSLPETSSKLSSNSDEKLNEINDSSVIPHARHARVIQSQSHIEERERETREPALFSPAQQDDASEVYVNGTCLKGSSFGTLLYESLDAVANSIGVDPETARQIAIANAKQWQANGKKVRDPLALVTASLRAHKRPAPKAKKQVDREYTDPFEAWWKLYPRKEGKGEAFDVWQRISKIENHRKAYRELQRQLPDLTARANDKRGNFCPHAQTWLRQGRFDDEPNNTKPTFETNYAAIREAAKKRRESFLETSIATEE